MAKRAAKGAGSIHKRTYTRNGKEYTYWEARITTGRDPLTGKQVQRTFSGKTQKEVREKMQAVAVEVNRGTYTPPCKMTVGEWLDIWQKNYLGGVKPATVSSYEYCIRLHIKPALGAARLDRIHPHTIQGFINALELAPQTVRHIWMVLHTALEKAVDLEYIPKNPADKCVLPKMDRVEIKPLDDGKAAALLTAANGTDLEHLVAVALFTGMRLSELLGLTWDSVDVERGSAQPKGQGDGGQEDETGQNGGPGVTLGQTAAFRLGGHHAFMRRLTSATSSLTLYSSSGLTGSSSSTSMVRVEGRVKAGREP